MRISSQNSQFQWSLPQDFIEEWLEKQFKVLLEKNLMPYDSPIDYLNSTIKEISMPGLTFEFKEQTLRYGKRFSHKDTKSIFDTFNNELDITFRSVDGHLNYFMMHQLLVECYLNTRKHHIPFFLVRILDKDGDLIYTIVFKDVLLKSLSEVRLSYHLQDISEKTFTVTFRYNFIDVQWCLDQNSSMGKSEFDVPTYFDPKGKLDM